MLVTVLTLASAAGDNLCAWEKEQYRGKRCLSGGNVKSVNATDALS